MVKKLLHSVTNFNICITFIDCSKNQESNINTYNTRSSPIADIPRDAFAMCSGKADPLKHAPPNIGYHAKFYRCWSNGMRSAGETGPFQGHSKSSDLARIDRVPMTSY